MFPVRAGPIAVRNSFPSLVFPSTALLLSGLYLALPFSAQSQTALPCGQGVNGNLTSTTQSDSYGLAAAAGDAITIRFRGPVFAGVELRDPSGSLVGSTRGVLDASLKAAGTYTLTVKASGGAGAYTLFWQRLNQPCNAPPLECGQRLQGSISAPGQVHFYTIAGVAGDRVMILPSPLREASSLFGGLDSVQIYSASGKRLDTQVTGSTRTPPTWQVEADLKESGTHTVILMPAGTTATEEYALVWQKLNSPCGAKSLDCGQQVYARIDARGDVHAYTFTAAEGDHFLALFDTPGSLGPVTGEGPFMELYGPGGIGPAFDGRHDANRLKLKLPAAGLYTFLIRAGIPAKGMGDYSLVWQRLNNPGKVKNLNCGESSLAEMRSTGEAHFYTFRAVAEDVLMVRLSGIGETAPTGAEVYEASSGERVWLQNAGPSTESGVLRATGLYTVVVWGTFLAPPSSYTLSWYTPNRPCSATELACGKGISGSLSTLGQVNFHRFNAMPKDQVRLSLTNESGWAEGSPFNPYLQLHASDGRYIFTSGHLPTELQTGGVHTVVVADRGAGTGNYTLLWEVVNRPCDTVPPQPTPGVPVIKDGGVVNAADYSGWLAPGMIISIFGDRLSSGTTIATAVPLPASLEGVSVTLTSEEPKQSYTAPLYFVSPAQINAQLPFELPLAGCPFKIEVKNLLGAATQTICSGNAALLRAAPGIFTKSMDGRGEAIVVRGDYSLVSAANPARAGESVFIYVNGLGPVDPPAQTGRPAGDGGALGPLNKLIDAVLVNMADRPAVVEYAGLAPGLVGVYQLNFRIPANVPPGNQVLSVRTGTRESNRVIIPCASQP